MKETLLALSTMYAAAVPVSGLLSRMIVDLFTPHSSSTFQNLGLGRLECKLFVQLFVWSFLVGLTTSSWFYAVGR